MNDCDPHAKSKRLPSPQAELSHRGQNAEVRPHTDCAIRVHDLFVSGSLWPIHHRLRLLHFVEKREQTFSQAVHSYHSR